jgi:transglutaminase-like putative cysteine protease
MRLEIEHRTRYSYEGNVFLGTQTLRLKPRTDANQRLLHYSLRIDPEPDSLTEVVDLDRSSATNFFYKDRVAALTIETHAAVETLRSNPFDYLWQGDLSLPMRYEEPVAASLQPFRSDVRTPQIRELLDRAAEDIGGNAQAFPMKLTSLIHDRVNMISRPEGEPLAPQDTLGGGQGSCRDVALLFIAVCREIGYAARFVSGYHAVDTDAHDLHAWAELYLPGGGWRGFDPTEGRAVADRHVAIVSAAEPSLAAPVSGTYRSRSSSYLDTQVMVRPMDDGEL